LGKGGKLGPMPHFPRAAARRLPALLALGLLALLLWGQCGLLNHIAPDQPIPHYSVRVVRVDSLTAARSTKDPTLYLTLEIHNKVHRAFSLGGVYGHLFLENHAWNNGQHYQYSGVVLAGGQTLQLPLALPLTASAALHPDSLRALRQALRQGSRRQKSLVLRVLANDYVYKKSANAALPLPPMP
jgi:hypothetical protein